LAKKQNLISENDPGKSCIANLAALLEKFLLPRRQGRNALTVSLEDPFAAGKK
jgi:hypothetical protein